MRTSRRLWVGVLVALMVAVSSCASDSDDAAARDVAGPVDIGGGRSVYLTCGGESRDGDPTVVLVSGYHDSSDVWTQSDVLSVIGSAAGPPVFEGVSASHRVCAYDRPGTVRYVEGTPLTDRSSPVPQPRTAEDIVAELSAVLSAGEVAGPYILVGHSLGGLIVRLYAHTHPDIRCAGSCWSTHSAPPCPRCSGPSGPAIATNC